jgi:pyridoxine 4-dehydrogenase
LIAGLTWRPEPQSDEESIRAMKAALDAGCNFWNGGEFYGTPERNSLQLLNKYFTKYPEDAEKVVLSIKGAADVANLRPDGSPEGVKRSIERCLELLDGKKKIDIFEPARVDQNTPIETTLKALEEYVKAGKIGGISLSEVSANTIQRAVKVTKVVGCEVELSLWSTDIFNNGVAAACAEHDIPIIAWVNLVQMCRPKTNIIQIFAYRPRNLNWGDSETRRYP